MYIEFAEWLLRNDNDKKEIIDYLNLAADYLINIEAVDGDEEDMDGFG